MNMQNICSEVTVVTTAYNAQKYLKEMIESVLNQSLLPINHIIVDDGSTDQTRAIVERYAQEHPTIRLVSPNKNLGRSAALNLGIEQVQTDYFAILDADDVAMKDWLEVTMHFLKSNPEYGVVGGGGNIMTEIGEVTNYMVCNASAGDVTSQIQSGVYLVLQPGTVYKTCFVLEAGGFNTVINTGEDNDMFMNLSFLTRIYHLGRPLIYYRRLRLSLSRITPEYSVLVNDFFKQKSEYLLTGMSISEANEKLSDWYGKFESIVMLKQVQSWRYDYEMARFFLIKKKPINFMKYGFLTFIELIKSPFSKLKGKSNG